MALPSVGGGRQLGDGNLNEATIGSAPAPITLSTGNFTLTAEQLTNGLILGSPGTGASAYTLPTGAVLDNLLTNAKVGSSFDVVVLPVDGSSSGVITMTTSTGWTLVGLMTVVATAGTAQAFRARRTGDGTWVLYRIG
jgi:hypothetical protein